MGEEVILLVARILNNTFRTYDYLYRFGGEHFAVLMHCPDEALVFAALERFRSGVARYNFPQVGNLTVSCGFTSVMATDTPGTALGKTDQAIEFAQKNGCNRVQPSGIGALRSGNERPGYWRSQYVSVSRNGR